MSINPASTPNWFRLLIFISLTVAIFFLSVVKSPGIRFSDHWFWDNLDKIGHAVAYMSLSVSGLWIFHTAERGKTQRSRALIIIFCFLYGLFIEIVQQFLPHRSFDLFDLMANAAGITLGSFAFSRIFP